MCETHQEEPGRNTTALRKVQNVLCIDVRRAHSAVVPANDHSSRAVANNGRERLLPGGGAYGTATDRPIRINGAGRKDVLCVAATPLNSTDTVPVKLAP